MGSLAELGLPRNEAKRQRVEVLVEVLVLVIVIVGVLVEVLVIVEAIY